MEIWENEKLKWEYEQLSYAGTSWTTVIFSQSAFLSEKRFASFSFSLRVHAEKRFASFSFSIRVQTETQMTNLLSKIVWFFCRKTPDIYKKQIEHVFCVSVNETLMAQF